MTCSCNCSGLTRKRKQKTKASCEACAARPLVDGIELVSSNVFSKMNLEGTKFINPNLWKTVKKGRRSMNRRPRKPTPTSFKVGNNLQQLSVFESEKLGVAVLGQHFAEKAVDVPIKKRRLLRHSPSPPPRTPSLNCEGSLSPQPQTPSPHPEESEQLVDSKCASGQWFCQDSLSKCKALKIRFVVDGVMNSKKTSELTNKEFRHVEDFSGIELLAAAACSSSIADHVEESSVVEELATPEGIDTSTAAMKETIALSESDGSSVQDNTVPVLQNIHNNENGGGVKRPVPSKDDRLHWDLNTVMDEWEEPCYDPPVDSQRNYSAGEKREKGDRTSSREVIGTIICKASDAKSSLTVSDKVDSFLPLPKCEELSSSATSILGGKNVVMGDSTGQVDIASTADNTDTHDFPVQCEPGKLMPKCDGQPVCKDLARGVFHTQKLCRSHGEEDPLCDGCGSSVLQGEQGHMVGGDNMTKVQAGYDSPFEDGELREPIAYDWEENEVEDREIECVDYEFDNTYEDDFDSQTVEDRNSLVVKDVSEKLGGKRTLDAIAVNIEQCAKGDAFKKPNRLVSFPGSYQSREHCEEVNLEGNVYSSRKFHPENKNGRDESRASRGDLLRTAFIQRSRSDNVGDSYSRSQRDYGSEKFKGRDRLYFPGRGGNEVDGRWADFSVGVWDSRNNYGYLRRRNVIGDSGSKSGGLNSHDHSQSRDYAPRGGMFRPLSRRRSPADRNDSYGSIHKGTLPVRGFSSDRSRGRSGFYPQRLRRGSQEEYHEAGPCYFERKERCFSPNFNRDVHISRLRRRSRSRSRTRSPVGWHLHRERNVDSRHHSPDYRERFPFQKPSFSSDIEGGFVSPTRSRLSPQRNPRCFDDRNCMDDHFRERISSPVRMFRPSQRFDSVGYPGRFKSDEYFRPMARPERHPQMAGAGRGRKYEDSSDDRRKHDDRYEMMNRVRSYDASGGGGMRRFRYDPDDSLEVRNSRNDEDYCFRGAVRRRDVPGILREVRGPPKFNSDRELGFTTGPLSTGERDCDEDASSAREG